MRMAALGFDVPFVPFEQLCRQVLIDFGDDIVCVEIWFRS